MSKPLVGIIMGSDSDLPVMKEAAKMCEYFGVVQQESQGSFGQN